MTQRDEKQDLRGIYEKRQRGDATTDAELQEIVKQVGPVVPVLLALGPEFRFAAVEAHKIVRDSEHYLQVRNRAIHGEERNT